MYALRKQKRKNAGGRSEQRKLNGLRVNSRKIFLVHSSSGHPQTQGSSESINTSIKSAGTTLTKEGYYFEQVLMIYKNIYTTTIYSSTGYLPAFLHFGRAITCIFHLFQAPQLDDIFFPFKYYKYMDSMKKIFKDVHNIKEAQTGQKCQTTCKGSFSSV